jgi:acetolactate synthase-1/2/3 large subunit
MFTGGEIVLKYLEKEGVPYIIGIPGHGCLGLFDAVRKSHDEKKIKYLQVKHEQAAVHIADGYFRISGKPLAVFTSIGPGALNTAIGMGTAYVDSSAVLLLTGDTHVHMKGVGVLQEIERFQDSNFIRALEPLSKRSWRVESVSQLPRIMRRAFSQMLNGRSGPVTVSIPMDVQSQGLDLNLSDWAQMEIGKCTGDSDSVARAVGLMKNSKRPVILAGGGALRSRCAEQLQELAELWGAAVVTTLAGKSVFPEDHVLYGLHTGSKGTPVGIQLCKEADVILALGTRFADETTCSYKDGESFSFPETKLIHVDIDPNELGKNYKCDVGIQGDLTLVLKQLIDHYKATVSNQRNYRENEYTKHILKLKEDWTAYLTEVRSIKLDKVTISQLIGELNRCLPKNAIIASSSGNTQAQLFQEYCFSEPYTNLTTGGFSTMGWAMPAAIGAKLAKPDSPVIALMGDGDFLMIMQELSTLAQYQIPVLVIMANNCGWMAIKDLQADMLGEKGVFGNDWESDGRIYTPDFHAIAEAFGVDSQKISRLDQIADAVEKALSVGGPAFIEVEVCREQPYSGGKSFGWWDVPIPAYLKDRRAIYETDIKGERV